MQKATFTRHGLRDNSLNKTDWGAWDADYYDLPAFAVPNITGYDADPSFIDQLRVHPTDISSIVHIYYHAHGNSGQITPVTPETPTTNKPSANTSTLSPTHSSANAINNGSQAKLPQTGSDNGFIASLLGTLPTMIALLAMTKRKKDED